MLSARFAMGSVILAWIVAVGLGLCVISRYSSTAGPSAKAQEVWPINESIPLATDGFTLVMTVHPQCPCSRASMAELELLMQHSGIYLAAYVLFCESSMIADSSTTSDLWQAATRINGVVAIHDPEGTRSQKLGAESSGHVLVYDNRGALKFSGGITPSRGHVGENDGRLAIEDLVNSARTNIKTTSVFGCSLQ